MKNVILKSRYFQILFLIFILMTVLIFRLFFLTVEQNDQWLAAAENQNTKEIIISAPRGRILDRNGVLLAGNRQIFTVELNVSGLSTEQINHSALELTRILEQNGDTYVENFPILMDESGGFYYSYDRDKVAWLEKNGLPLDATPEEAFNKIRNEKEIDPELDRFEALEYLQKAYGIYPPLYIRSMQFSYDAEKKSFLEKYFIDKNLTAEEAFREMRKMYSIDESLSDEEVRKLFSIRYEIKGAEYNKYRSSVVASNISDASVIALEERNRELLGISVGTDTVRYYPQGNLLAHALGYMGRIEAVQYDEYVTEKGYQPDDLVGKDGLEYYLEEHLRGQDGRKTVLVNSTGDYVKTVSEEPAVPGKDVYITVDAELQRVATKALSDGIAAVREGEVFRSAYGNYKMRESPNCSSGAIVAVDVTNGDVLATVSLPDYDPNIFSTGISSEDWASVQSTNPRDPLAATPLHNNATMMSVQPGSTFKPITALAALECGLDPTRKIKDGGNIVIGDISFGCWVWNMYRGTHGYENVRQGISNSCNYYMYCIATGIDWNGGSNGPSLGYKEPISIEKIIDVAKRLGLGEKTGIELYEAITPIPTAERKMREIQISLWNTLYFGSSTYWPEKIVNDEYLIRKEIDKVTGWIQENPDRGTLINKILSETKALPEKAEDLADLCKYSYFNQATWGVGDAFNICIGQGSNSYTPVQMATYTASVANGGVRNRLSLIKSIDNVEPVKDAPFDANLDKAHLYEVTKGMEMVVVNSMGGNFRNFGWTVAGKTGTAERDGYINPADEVAYVKDNLGKIAPGLTWEVVEAKMQEIMKSDPKKYPTENDAVDLAVVEASGRTVSFEKINSLKSTYESFTWIISFAPSDAPKIAVVALLVQGRESANNAPIIREVLGNYLTRYS